MEFFSIPSWTSISSWTCKNVGWECEIGSFTWISTTFQYVHRCYRLKRTLKMKMEFFAHYRKISRWKALNSQRVKAFHERGKLFEWMNEHTTYYKHQSEQKNREKIDSRERKSQLRENFNVRVNSLCVASQDEWKGKVWRKEKTWKNIFSVAHIFHRAFNIVGRAK